MPGGFAVNALMDVAREIDNDGPAAARFLRDFHRACVGGVFGGVAGLTKAYQSGNLEPLNIFDP
jgi:hypothetical protein